MKNKNGNIIVRKNPNPRPAITGLKISFKPAELDKTTEKAVSVQVRCLLVSDLKSPHSLIYFASSDKGGVVKANIPGRGHRQGCIGECVGDRNAADE